MAGGIYANGSFFTGDDSGGDGTSSVVGEPVSVITDLQFDVEEGAIVCKLKRAWMLATPYIGDKGMVVEDDKIEVIKVVKHSQEHNLEPRDGTL